MYRRGVDLGMTPLVELHDADDVKKAAVFKPSLVGINSRDLKSFRIKPLDPLKIRALIDWDCRIVYESGVRTEDDIAFVRETGFDAVLVGEAAVRTPGFSEKLISLFTSTVDPDRNIPDPLGRFGFWKKLYRRCREGRPLVKICGITNQRDLDEIVRLGADAAGFILAESPRKVEERFIRSCRGADILKVGVVVLAEGEPVPEDIVALLREGYLDALQFHGRELPSEYGKWPGYKAVRIATEEDAEGVGTLPGPAVLVDAWSAAAPGGTGKRIDPLLVKKVAERQTLWLAGGINPDNVEEIIRGFHPDLIDLSSGVESAPGRKDHDKLRRLFDGIERAADSVKE
jgi:indole-3-glycerol phosphate synthase/phosphoribosylanthranilate isomerase